MRVAGVKVGQVESLALEDGAVTVEFRVKDAFVGDRSEAAIKKPIDVTAPWDTNSKQPELLSATEGTVHPTGRAHSAEADPGFIGEVTSALRAGRVGRTEHVGVGDGPLTVVTQTCPREFREVAVEDVDRRVLDRAPDRR